MNLRAGRQRQVPDGHSEKAAVTLCHQLSFRDFEDVAEGAPLCSRLVGAGGGLAAGGVGFSLGGRFAIDGTCSPGSVLGLERPRPADLDAAVEIPWVGAGSDLEADAGCTCS